MIATSQKYQKILGIFLKKGKMQSSDVYGEMTMLGESTSLVTVKRSLSEMAGQGIVAVFGSGRSTS